ncbi:hypothetical protein [Nocardia neocaledoniensis]|uniref:hypothetical protein n=1 Tax=Nocardia neocaledoniensis TaxID=236511 RepID=UPI002456A78A|nr:hypothetical protein [Nocardia neocaledoniensis]
MSAESAKIPLVFSDFFGIDSQVVQDYGAFDICLIADLPLFIDPFLLFESEKPEYQKLHQSIIEYLTFLKDKSGGGGLDAGLISSWYRFKEVEQNWLGFSATGNSGHGLGRKFADSLYGALGDVLSNFGEEQITRSSHLEKLTLIRSGVGRDSISDFTTNLIKRFLLEYTEKFAKEHLDPKLCREFAVDRVYFSYSTETWRPKVYYLPKYLDDFVLLTPSDLLTRDDTWISHSDMIKGIHRLPAAVSNSELRSQMENYLLKNLLPGATQAERSRAAIGLVNQFPELIDYYIKMKEDAGQDATAESAEKVRAAYDLFVDRLRSIAEDLADNTEFYDVPSGTYAEALARVHVFKRFIENEDGYLLLNDRNRPLAKERDVQLLFAAIWKGSRLDVNREVNNGRGPVDFKVSYGALDSSLLELKLARNSHLKKNLANQVEVYKAANNTDKAIKVIVCYSAAEQKRVDKILAELDIAGEEAVVVIDARNDNKPSGSKA